MLILILISALQYSTANHHANHPINNSEIGRRSEYRNVLLKSFLVRLKHPRRAVLPPSIVGDEVYRIDVHKSFSALSKRITEQVKENNIKPTPPGWWGKKEERIVDDIATSDQLPVRFLEYFGQPIH